ncbi:unnamed protein product [Calypogeia fissa]
MARGGPSSHQTPLRTAAAGGRGGVPSRATIEQVSPPQATICNTWPDYAAPLLLRNLSKNLAVLSSSPPVRRRAAATSKSPDVSLVCRETVGGADWNIGSFDSGLQRWNRVRPEVERDHLKETMSFLKSYVVPEGYPNSVAPAYTPYMQWRAVQYFFGGAMSVFTTRSLLHALGVSRKGSASGAVAVHWVIKDGAGRIGRMIFARHGKKFDCHLKQLRFGADLLMEMAAGVELLTMSFPQLFLPLACAASVAKNVAAVTATSTRAPIYKAFARAENIGDVTAKGECISNIADLFGTALGIFLSKRNPSMVLTFMTLSTGYVIGSYKEVKAVRLPTMNRARFGMAAEAFLDTGQVPSVEYANANENILFAPFALEKPVEVGARVLDAFTTPQEFQVTRALFERENYLLTYNTKRRRAYVVLKASANSDDVLRAAFHAHVLLKVLKKVPLPNYEGRKVSSTKKVSKLSSEWSCEGGVMKAVAKSYEHLDPLFKTFKQEAATQGWIMKDSLLNPGDSRISFS